MAARRQSGDFKTQEGGGRRQREELVRRDGGWEKGGKTEEMAWERKTGGGLGVWGAPEWHRHSPFFFFCFSAFKQFFHVPPPLLAFLCISLTDPVHLLPSESMLLPPTTPHPPRPRARPSQFLSLFLFIFFLLWIIYCSRGEWKCVYFECVCALNRMLNDCRWERLH